jgi:hypothetical protein
MTRSTETGVAALAVAASAYLLGPAIWLPVAQGAQPALGELLLLLLLGVGDPLLLGAGAALAAFISFQSSDEPPD